MIESIFLRPIIVPSKINKNKYKDTRKLTGSLLKKANSPHLTISLKHFALSLKWTELDRVWSGGAMVLGKLPVPGRPTIWIIVGQGTTALIVGAGGGCLDIFTLIYPFLSSFSLSLGDGPI